MRIESERRVNSLSSSMTCFAILCLLIISTMSISINGGISVIDQEDHIGAGGDTGDGNEPMGGSGSNPPIRLSYGWNLVSFPYVVTDKSMVTVLSSIAGKYDAVQAYDSWDSQDPWKYYNVDKPSGLNDLARLDNTMGFWIHITDPSGADLYIDGDVPSSQVSIYLNKGWNLVGYPSEDRRLRYDALNNLSFSNDLDTIQFFNATEKKWYNMTSSDSFEPGRGYWIYAKRDVIWRIPMPNPPYMTPGKEHYLKFKDQEILYYVPQAYENNPQETRIFFIIHGAGRQYVDNFNVWMIKEVSEDYNVVLVSPHFDTVNFTKYHRLNVGYGERADWRLIEIAENFTQWLNLTSNKFYIFGFSGGGQFTHRFVMAHPEYIERAVAGAPGVYTFPNATIPYSHGLNLSEYEPIDLEFNLENAYRENMSIMVGCDDTERGDDLSKSEASDAQGLNRLERARNFFNATSENATENGWEYNYSLQEILDCEHTYGPMKTYIIDYLFL